MFDQYENEASKVQQIINERDQYKFELDSMRASHKDAVTDRQYFKTLADKLSAGNWFSRLLRWGVRREAYEAEVSKRKDAEFHLEIERNEARKIRQRNYELAEKLEVAEAKAEDLRNRMITASLKVMHQRDQLSVLNNVIARRKWARKKQLAKEKEAAIGKDDGEGAPMFSGLTQVGALKQ